MSAPRASLSIRQFELELVGTNSDVQEALGFVREAIGAPLARLLDPKTSHAAAARASEFAGEHERLIVEWLLANPSGGTYREIAAGTRLEPVAVGRRMKGLRDTAGVYADGKRNGMQIYKVKRPA